MRALGPIPFAFLAAAGWLGACTFPDVEYSTTGSGGTSSGPGTGGGAKDGGADEERLPCMVSKQCAKDDEECAKKADDAAKSCAKKCDEQMMEGNCQDGCDATHKADLDQCTTECVSCVGGDACADAQQRCADLSGP